MLEPNDILFKVRAMGDSKRHSSKERYFYECGISWDKRLDLQFMNLESYYIKGMSQIIADKIYNDKEHISRFNQKEILSIINNHVYKESNLPWQLNDVESFCNKVMLRIFSNTGRLGIKERIQVRKEEPLL